MDNIYSAYHYACKTKADKEAVEQIYEEVKKSAQNAIYRNIGDIFFTARTDTEINGAVECNGGTYSTADFEGKQNVGNLLASGSLPYVSLSEYESLVSANGSCRAFGWDGGDSFRVPTIPALLLIKEQSAVVGNGMTLGLTNGTTNMGSQTTAQNGIGFQPVVDIYGNNLSSTPQGGTIGTGIIGVTADPTKSGIVANLDVIEYRAMVQLASGATDQAVITATSALQQITNKANSDLSNVASVASSFKEQSVGWGMPDYGAGVQVNLPYTAPTDGFIYAYCAGNNAYYYLEVNGVRMVTISTQGTQQATLIPISKGDVLTKNQSSGNNSQYFYPLKGVN